MAAGGLPGFMSPRLSSPAHHSQAGGGGGGRGGGHTRGRGRGRGGGNIGRDRELIGQTIKITQGPYKGHIGIVKVKIIYLKKPGWTDMKYVGSNSSPRPNIRLSIHILKKMLLFQ